MITVEGTYSFTGSGTDVYGLDGTTFHYRINAGDYTSFNSTTYESTLYEDAERTVTLAGTLQDGDHPSTQSLQTVHIQDASSLDRIFIGGARFDIDSYFLEIPTIQITFAGGGFINTAGPDPIPVFSARDYSGIFLSGVELRSSTNRIAEYDFTGLTTSAQQVAVPGTSLLMGLFGLHVLRRRQRDSVSPRRY